MTGWLAVFGFAAWILTMAWVLLDMRGTVAPWAPGRSRRWARGLHVLAVRIPWKHTHALVLHRRRALKR